MNERLFYLTVGVATYGMNEHWSLRNSNTQNLPVLIRPSESTYMS